MNGWKSDISHSWSGCVQNAEFLLILTRNPVAGRDGTRRLVVRKIRSYLAVDPNFGELRMEEQCFSYFGPVDSLEQQALLRLSRQVC